MTAMLNQTSVDSSVLNRVGEALANASQQNREGWLAGQVPLRMGSELVRLCVPGANRLLMKLGEKARKQQFPKQVERMKADTSFTPVKKLAR